MPPLSKTAFLQLCEGAPVEKFKAEDVLMRQGEEGAFCYVILRGEVAIDVTNPQTMAKTRVAIRGAGELIGELSLFQKTRSATVIALEVCECALIPHAVLLQIITAQHSLALALLAATMEKAREHTA
jgi:CRP/FNR family transcriptional regulator, cyclic AMP receptor protein